MSLSKLKSVFVDLSSDPIAIGHLTPGADTAQIVYTNKACQSLLKYDETALIGQPVDMLHDQESWEDFVGKVQPHFQAGDESFKTDTKLVRSDGTMFWASVAFVVTEDEDNGGRLVCATYRDISELKAAEASANLAHRRMVDALNAYPDPIVIYDKDFKLVSWNEAYVGSITRNPEDLKQGMDLRSVLEIAAQSGLYKAAIGHEQAWIERIVSTQNLDTPQEDVELEGDIHHRLIRSRSAAGDYVVVRLNTTELVRQRRAAEDASARLVGALNAYPAPFAIYDAEDCLRVWNKAYSASMSKDPAKLKIGMHRTDVARVAIADGKLVAAIGNEEEWMSEQHQSIAVQKPVQDLELAGDIHHRLLRSRAENGDLVMLRIDITELVRHRRALDAARGRLVSAIQAYPDPFAIYDAGHNLVIWNQAYAESMTDDPASLTEGIHLKTLLLQAAVSGRIPGVKGRETEWVDEYYSPDVLNPGIEDFEFADDRHYRMVRSRTESGEFVVMRMNVTEVVRQRRALEEYARKLEAANQESMRQALHDDLTGMGNRRYLGQRFDELLHKRTVEGGEIAALHIDLDRFKQINDTMGHAAGDKVLIDCAERIKAVVDYSDTIARIGGDEFVILLHFEAESNRPEELAERLLAELSRPSIIEGKECRFGASIGIAQTPLSDVDALLTNSDVALYKAKNKGRRQAVMFDQGDLEDVRNTKAVADDILRGIENCEFVPFYQPQVSAQTGAVVGFEALARWRHPTKGILAPDAFLSIATDLNVVADIDRMIFETAVAECSLAFGASPAPPSLSFNVSARRVGDVDLSGMSKHLNSYPGTIAFELLETIFLEEEDDQFLERLDEFRKIGISLEVDDFGSGRASVVALQRISPDRLKIDRRLVSPIEQSESGARLLRSIVEIGHALGMGVTAEGVETAAQADILAQLGCDILQGFHIARPKPLSEVFGFLRDTKLCEANAPLQRFRCRAGPTAG